MTINGRFRFFAIALSCALVTMPQMVQAAQPGSIGGAAIVVQDVALLDGGVLRGYAFDSSGQKIVGAPVIVSRDRQVVGESVTNQDGQFTIGQLTGGVYQVAVNSEVSMCRLWAPNTAPPAAKDHVMIVDGSQVLRGNHGGGHAFLRSPWLWGGVVAAAIAIPLALRNDAS